MTRQSFARLAQAAPLAAGASSLRGAEPAGAKRLAVCAYSYNFHWRAAREGRAGVRFRDTIEFLEYCHELGCSGVQAGLGSREPGYPAQVRAKAESLSIRFEGQVGLPREASDAARFESDIRAAKEAGAEVVRGAMLSGRRYETFESEVAFRKFADASWDSLGWAEPILKRHRMRLALENHKDWRVPELLEMLKRLGSEWVGVCVDTGNNIALLEDPMGVVEALAPLAFTSHLKDMGVQEYEAGFLLSEVPLGDGFLDIPEIVAVLRRHNPAILLNLEMITRDPLKVPCLTDSYWATMPGVPASEAAAALARVRRNISKAPLPRTTGLSAGEQLALEDQNVRRSFAYARRELSMASK